MKDFTNDDDIRESQQITKSTGRFIKIENGETPVYLLSADYTDGFVHFVQLPNGDYETVVCGGGAEGGGYAPEECEICAVCKERYAEARRLESHSKDRANALRKATNRIRGSYSLHLLAAAGEMSYGGKSKSGKRIQKIDFSTPEVGVLALSKAQREKLLGLVGNPSYPFIESRKDLFNRVIKVTKGKEEVDWSDTEVTVVDFIPSKAPHAAPKVEYDEDELDMSEDFEIDLDQIHKVASVLLGDEEEDDGEVDFEDDELDDEPEEEFDADEEDDEDFEFSDEEEEDDEEEEEFDEEEEAEPDFDEEEEVEEASSTLDDDFLDDVDDDFEDDLPWDKDEEEPAVPKKSTKKAPAKKTSSDSKVSNTRKAPAKKTPAKSTASKPKSGTTKAAPKSSTRKPAAKKTGTTKKTASSSRKPAAKKPTTRKKAPAKGKADF